MNHYLCFIDTETTSVKPWATSLVQVAFIIYDMTNKKFVTKFNSHVRPFESDPEPDPKALEVNGLLLEDLPTFPDPIEVQTALTNFWGKYVDKFDTKAKMHFVAYNAPFDYDVLQAFWKKCNEATGKSKNYLGSYFWKQPIDVMILANNFLKEERYGMKNFKQCTVAEQLGIDFSEDELHDALADIKLMIKIYKKIGGF